MKKSWFEPLDVSDKIITVFVCVCVYCAICSLSTVHMYKPLFSVTYFISVTNLASLENYQTSIY